MEPITILPHHALSYFEFYYLGRDPDKNNHWYDSHRFRDEAVKRVQAVLNNPDQLVRLVSGYDDWCRFCPYHKDGENYNPNNKPCVRDDWNIPGEVETAKTVGLDSVLDKETITSKQFFEIMKPTYERLIAEPLYQDKSSKTKSLRQLFRYYELHLQIPKDFEDFIQRLERLGLNDKIIMLLSEFSNE